MLWAQESCKEGAAERCSSGDGAFDCARDSTVDGALIATLDKAGDEGPDLEAECNGWSESLVNMNWVSFD